MSGRGLWNQRRRLTAGANKPDGADAADGAVSLSAAA